MQSFTKRRILIVGKETFMYPFFNIIDEWKKENVVAMFWINQNETEFEKCELNASTYYEFKKKDGIIHYTLKKAVEEYTQFLKNKELNVSDLEELERRYSRYKNLNLQILSDQRFSSQYHYRTMYGVTTYEEQMKWIEILYRTIEGILDEYTPDVIFDCDIAELPRTVLNEVAHSRGIPYICISFSQYQTYKIASYKQIFGNDDYFVEEYNKCLKNDNAKEVEYVQMYRNQNEIKNTSYISNGNLTYNYAADSLYTIIKDILGHGVYFFHQDISQKNRRLKKSNPILFINSRKYMLFWINYLFRRRRLLLSKKFFETPVEGEQYVYMPLHLIPESTTFSMAPFWINELSAIEAVAKAVPIGWRVYVKEHQSMIGERGIDFYNKVKKIPNVRLVKTNYYTDPKPWIVNSKAVITVTGTAAYEAAMLGVPAFTFGIVPFSVMKGVRKITSIEELPELLGNLQQLDNIKECAAYIKAVKNVGRPVDLFYIQESVYEKLVLGKDFDNKYYMEIDNLRKLFEEAFLRLKHDNLNMYEVE